MNDTALSQIEQALKTNGFKEIHFEHFARLYAMLGVTGRGLGMFDFLDAVIKYPELLHQKPETIDGNAVDSAALLGITKQAFVAAALGTPYLLCQKPETLDGNAEVSAALLGISKQVFVAAALKQRQLLYQNPETLDDNASKSAALLGISKETFVTTALKHPQLLTHKPETLDGKAQKSAALLGISKQAFLTAALKQPSLLSQKPETLNKNAAASAGLLEVTKQAFVAAALKQPSLLHQRPETIYSKKSYILKIKDALNDTGSFDVFIFKAPVALGCASSRLHVCYVLAKLNIKHGRLSSLVCLPARDAERLLVNYFEDRIATNGRGARTLQIMHAMKMIQNLPAGIAPISRPNRARTVPKLQTVQPC